MDVLKKNSRKKKLTSLMKSNGYYLFHFSGVWLNYLRQYVCFQKLKYMKYYIHFDLMVK